MTFYAADLTDEQFYSNRIKAYKMYETYLNGEELMCPEFSSGICESVTCGYGRLDPHGYFEYPLVVNQSTLDIIPLESL